MKTRILTIIIILLSLQKMNAQDHSKIETKDIESIKNCLIGFMSAMNKWELNSFEEGNKLEVLAKDKSINDKRYYEIRDSLANAQSNNYMAIFKKYAIPNLKDYQGPYGNPPIYDPVIETIDSVQLFTADTAIILTSKKRVPDDEKRKYFLKKIDNQWFLYDKLFWIERTQEWIESGGL